MLPIPLPPELIVHVLSFVPGNDIRRFRAISKEFAAVLERNKRYLHKPKLSLRFYTDGDPGNFTRYMTVSTDKGDIQFDVTEELMLVNDDGNAYSDAVVTRYERETRDFFPVLHDYSEYIVAAVNIYMEYPQILIPLPNQMNPGAITMFLKFLIKATNDRIDEIHIDDTLGRVMFYGLCQFIWEQNVRIGKFDVGWVNSFHNFLQIGNINGKILTTEKSFADRLDQVLGPDFTRNGQLNGDDVRANALAVQFNVDVNTVYVWFGDKAIGLL